MKNTYIILTLIGFIAPNILVIQESFETGNILLYADLASTFENMFANRISSIFSIDLLIAVLVFFMWTYHESKRLNIPKFWIVWLLTMLFGLAGALPLFLYKRENQLTASSSR